MSLVQKPRGSCIHICPLLLQVDSFPFVPAPWDSSIRELWTTESMVQGHISNITVAQETITRILFLPSLTPATSVLSSGKTDSVVLSIRILIKWPFDLRTYFSTMQNRVIQSGLQPDFHENFPNPGASMFLPRTWCQQVSVRLYPRSMID